MGDLLRDRMQHKIEQEIEDEQRRQVQGYLMWEKEMRVLWGQDWRSNVDPPQSSRSSDPQRGLHRQHSRTRSVK